MHELTNAEAIELLTHGTLELEGLVPWGSNRTFLVQVCHEGIEAYGVYKPRRGERPLWDFAQGSLCLRERAAYALSELSGWSLVPPTVMRDGPHGEGSLQLFVDHDPDVHYFTFEGQHPEQIQRIVLFDVVSNNADRKAGHVLLGHQNRLWAIDNGLCFHADFKLRTVIWEYAGLPMRSDQQAELIQLKEKIAARHRPETIELLALLSKSEYRALAERLERLIQSGIYPVPGPGRHYPWPLV